jgi:hypothetical protein
VNKYKSGFFFSYDFVGESSWNGYEQRCLFANLGGHRFMDVARPLGADSTKDGRGVAVADLNGDGRLDVVINNNNAAPTVYFNRLRKTGNWLRLDLVGTVSNRDAIGAVVRVSVRSGGREITMMRQVEAGSGYASQSESTLHFGLGDARRVERVEIAWPSGLRQVFRGAELDGMVNRRASVREGGSQILREINP